MKTPIAILREQRDRYRGVRDHGAKEYDELVRLIEQAYINGMPIEVISQNSGIAVTNIYRLFRARGIEPNRK